MTRIKCLCGTAKFVPFSKPSQNRVFPAREALSKLAYEVAHHQSPNESHSIFPGQLWAEHTHLVQSVDPNVRFISSFVDYLKVEKGLAGLTVAAYQSDLAQYLEFLEKRKRAMRDARRQ